MNSIPLSIALDSLSTKEESTLAVVRSLNEVEGNFGWKVNLDFITHKTAKGAVETLKPFGRDIFVDLKMWNGKRTMSDLAKELADLGVKYINLYALADDQIPKVIEAVAGSGTLVLAVTVLTHYDDDYCQKHFLRSLSKTVRHLADTALVRGCHGIILPGTCLGAVTDLDTIKVIPGVRPSWFKDDRHSEEITPSLAIAGGAKLLVCGSPIMKSEDKPAALRRIIVEMPKVEQAA